MYIPESTSSQDRTSSQRITYFEQAIIKDLARFFIPGLEDDIRELWIFIRTLTREIDDKNGLCDLSFSYYCVLSVVLQLIAKCGPSEVHRELSNLMKSYYHFHGDDALKNNEIDDELSSLEAIFGSSISVTTLNHHIHRLYKESSQCLITQSIREDILLLSIEITHEQSLRVLVLRDAYPDVAPLYMPGKITSSTSFLETQANLYKKAQCLLGEQSIFQIYRYNVFRNKLLMHF